MCKGQTCKNYFNLSTSDTIRIVLSVVLRIALVEMHRIYFFSMSMEF